MNPALQALIVIVIGVGGCITYFYASNLFLDKVLFPAKGPNAGRNTNRANMVRPWLFLFPAMALLSLYLAYPVFATAWLSLHNKTGAFVGFGNYTAMFAEPKFMESLQNNIVWLIVVPAASTAFGLLAAQLTDRIRWGNFAKSLIFMPMAISFVGASVIFKLIYDSRDANLAQIGLINAVWLQFNGGVGSFLMLRLVPFVLTVVCCWLSFIGLVCNTESLDLYGNQGGFACWPQFSGPRFGYGKFSAVLPLFHILLGLAVAVFAIAPLFKSHKFMGTVGLLVALIALAVSLLLAIQLGRWLYGIATNPLPFGTPQVWLQKPYWNNFFLMAVLVWIQTGFAMVILSAALRGVPEDTIEAATIDGANPFQIFFKIKVPQIMGTIVVVWTTITITVLKVFDIVLAMTNGQWQTQVLANYMYDKLFRALDWGMGSASAMIIMLLVTPILIWNVINARKEMR